MKLSKILFAFAAATIFCGCEDKKNSGKNPEQAVEIEEKSSDHKWYYFSSGSYVETDLPEHSPILSLKPWTESLRICDGNVDSLGKGILLVNHFGVLLFENSDEPKLIQDSALFSTSTAGNLVFENDVPFFTLSKNSLFNKNLSETNPDSVKNQEESHVVRLSLENSMFFPCVTYSDLKIEYNAEVSGTYFDGKNWFSSIKINGKGKTDFRYIKWSSNGSLASLSPAPSPEKITISEISKDEYRKINAPKNFSSAPSRLKNLLSSIPADFDFLLSLHRNGGASPEYFFGGSSPDGKTAENVNDDGAEANAILTPEWICAIFGDGTAYFSGSLKGRTLLNNGKTVAFRLPKLPKEYVYGDFCISGDYLAVSWEENDFYKTGRSGFLVVNMAEIFY